MAASANKIAFDADDRTLVIERVFDATREMVWEAFTDPARVVCWKGPRQFPAVEFSTDATPGGKWRGKLRSLDGKEELGQGGVIREIVKPKRLVYTFQWDKRFAGDETPETLITIELEDVGSKTRMRFTQGVFNTASNCRGHGEGWNSSFDRLAECLAKEESIHSNARSAS